MRRIFIPSFVILLSLAACGPSEQQTANPPRSASESTLPAAATNPPGDSAEVAHVFDGDSLEVLLDDGTRVELRLLGINAPEGDECYGNQARSALEEWLTDSKMTLVADDEEADQFGRVLRYVYVDGTNVNLAMIEAGNALAIQTGHAQDQVFAETSDAAAAAGLGMWATDACGSDTDLPALAIVDYVYDPRGRDADNPNGEWVAIANTGTTPVAMEGWILRDESTQNRFRFPNEFSLKAGGEAVIHSGCGTDTASDLYWCASDPVWSNGGDTIVLQSPDGTIVARDRYVGEY
jgi:micrococcal nuclease